MNLYSTVVCSLHLSTHEKCQQRQRRFEIMFCAGRRPLVDQCRDSQHKTMDNSQSSISSHHYGALLQTVSELRSDLEKTTLKIKSLQVENDSLSAQANLSREELSDVKKRFNEARESYLAAVTEKFEAEQQHDAMIDRLKAQLQEKTKDFEKIRDELVPHDIDQLRIKVQEELEIRHKQELKAVEADLELQKEKTFSVRRDLEKTRAEFTALTQNQQGEINSLRAEREALAETVRIERQAAKSRSGDNSGTKDQTIRSQANKLAETAHLVELLKEELKTARQDRDETNQTLIATRSKLEGLQATSKAKLAALDAEHQGLKLRGSLLQAEVDKRDGQLQMINASQEEQARRIEDLQRDKEAAERAILAANSDFQNQFHLLQTASEKERRELQEHVETLRNMLQDREDTLQRIQREASEMQTRAEGIERDLRRTHLVQLQELRKKLTACELDLADAVQSTRIMQDRMMSTQEQMSHDKDSLMSDVSRLKREKEVLVAKLRDSEGSNEATKRKHLVVQQELTAKLTATEKKVREAVLQSSQQESKTAALTSRIVELERDRQSVRDSYDELEQRYNAMLLQVDAMKTDFHKQIQAVAPNVKDRMETLQRQMTAAVAKERKRAEGYKAKALDAHYRIKASLDAAGQLQS